jgi:hypothetical protein
MHMTGGVSAESNSSGREERGDEVALSPALVPGCLSAWYRVRIQQTHFLNSLDNLRDQILALIAYYNRTMAKPIKWTYTGLV